MSIKGTFYNMLGSLTQRPNGEESIVVADDTGGTVIFNKRELAKKLHGFASACQHAIANGVAGLEIVAKDPKTLKPVSNSRDVVNKVFSCKRTKLTRQDLLYKLASDLAMAGNAYMVNLGGSTEYVSGNVTVKEWDVLAGIVSVVKSYEVDTGLQTPKEVLADKMMHFKYRLLDGAASGRGALEDCNLEADAGIEIARFVSAYFRNFAMPGMHVRITKNGIKAAAFKRLADKIQQSFGGGGRGGTFVTSDSVTATPLGSNLVDAKAVDVMNTLKVVVCGAYGVPVDIIDTTNTNRATAQASLKMFHTNTVMPIAWAICDRFNQAYDSVMFEPVPYDTIDALEGDKVIVSMVEKGIVTREEARVRLRSVSLTDGKKGVPE